MLHDDVVDGCLSDRCCVGPWLEHKLGKNLSEVRSSGDGSFESCDMVRRVIEDVTLLAVYIVALCCANSSE